MSLRFDLDAAIKNLRITLQNLDSDLQRFEGLVEEHFTIEGPKINKVPPQVFQNLEKEIKDIKATNTK